MNYRGLVHLLRDVERLAPDIAVTFYKQRDVVGIVRAKLLAEATLAVVSVNDGASAYSAEFELPAHASQLDLCLGAILIAYARGHLDRTHITMDRLGFALADRMPPAKVR